MEKRIFERLAFDFLNGRLDAKSGAGFESVLLEHPDFASRLFGMAEEEILFRTFFKSGVLAPSPTIKAGRVQPWLPGIAAAAALFLVIWMLIPEFQRKDKDDALVPASEEQKKSLGVCHYVGRKGDAGIVMLTLEQGRAYIEIQRGNTIKGHKVLSFTDSFLELENTKRQKVYLYRSQNPGAN